MFEKHHIDATVEMTMGGGSGRGEIGQDSAGMHIRDDAILTRAVAVMETRSGGGL